MVLWGLYNVSRKRVPYIEETKKRESHTREKRESHTREKRELPKGRHLEKEDSQERELCMEKKIERRGQSVAAFERDN